MSTIEQGFDHRDVTVQLTGEDGNAFTIIGTCAQAIRRDAGDVAATTWVERATRCTSYDSLLAFCVSTLDVT